MLYSPHPLREKMTLFWHNHFATSNAKVQNAGFMLGQYELLRRHALGNFATLLQEMSNDPAMLVWLDTTQSKKGNAQRELRPRADGAVQPRHRQLHRAGHPRGRPRLHRLGRSSDGKAVFNADQHDAGEKTVLGQTRQLARATTSSASAWSRTPRPYFIVGKLFRFLVSETVPATPELLEPLATQFRDERLRLRRAGRDDAAVEPVLLAAGRIARRIKSPVDFALGIVRGLEGRRRQRRPLGRRRWKSSGRTLFYPPSVKGWDGGPAWLNGQTLLFRQNLALALTSTEDDRFGTPHSTRPAWPASTASTADEELSTSSCDLFLQGDVPPSRAQRLLEYQQNGRQAARCRSTGPTRTRPTIASAALCHLVLTLPEFQLD